MYIRIVFYVPGRILPLQCPACTIKRSLSKQRARPTCREDSTEVKVLHNLLPDRNANPIITYHTGYIAAHMSTVAESLNTSTLIVNLACRPSSPPSISAGIADRIRSKSLLSKSFESPHDLAHLCRTSDAFGVHGKQLGTCNDRAPVCGRHGALWSC